MSGICEVCEWVWMEACLEMEMWPKVIERRCMFLSKSDKVFGGWWIWMCESSLKERISGDYKWWLIVFSKFFFKLVCVFLMQVNALVSQCDVFVFWSVVLECKACMVFLQWASWLCFSCAILWGFLNDVNTSFPRLTCVFYKLWKGWLVNLWEEMTVKYKRWCIGG
jgi:hypothetical protein